MSDLQHLHEIGTAAWHRVFDAASDTEAVAEATGALAGMVERWSEANEPRRRELWSEAAHASDGLYERFRERIDALPKPSATPTTTQPQES